MYTFPRTVISPSIGSTAKVLTMPPAKGITTYTSMRFSDEPAS